MNILVTGAGGFLGRLVAQYLSIDHTVFSPNRKQLELRDSTMVDEFFMNHHVDVVVHCATDGRHDVHSTDPAIIANNLAAFLNLSANRHLYGRLINFGTLFDIGLDGHDGVIDTHTYLDYLPTQSYSLSKNLIARSMRGIPNFVNMRLFGVFHESEPPSRFFQKMKRDDYPTISTDRKFDYFYAEDIFKVLDVLIKMDAVPTDINLVYSEKYTLCNQAEILFDILGIRKPIIISGVGKNFIGNNSVLDSLGIPLTGLENGLDRYKT